ncbi:MAG TPA: PRC-barrel domain-containing protein [Thermomicrobiales bacterium]|nr:PRC-barrel domain-containing protein [Thermomicrobiales bacterium]
MTLNISSDNDQQPVSSGTSETREFATVIGLFEDMIDARHALSVLRKEGCPREAVSMIVRDRKADEGGPAQRHGAVAKAVEEADLNGYSQWLTGLASIIVAERGTFLVSGPIGAALAAVTLDDADELDSALATILGDFGFAGDEVTYIESRILAGAMMVAVTSPDPAIRTSARNLMSNDNAVHIGAARTATEVADAAIELLESPPEVYDASDVVVTDVVAPLQILIDGKQGVEWARSLKGTQVVDRDGIECGRIENLIAEHAADDEAEVGRDLVRYVVVSFGGMLGIGRRMAAVPIEHVTISDAAAQIRVSRDVLQDAPTYVAGAPFSRREEQVVCAYFGCTPYWSG